MTSCSREGSRESAGGTPKARCPFCPKVWWKGTNALTSEVAKHIAKHHRADCVEMLKHPDAAQSRRAELAAQRVVLCPICAEACVERSFAAKHWPLHPRGSVPLAAAEAATTTVEAEVVGRDDILQSEAAGRRSITDIATRTMPLSQADTASSPHSSRTACVYLAHADIAPDCAAAVVFATIRRANVSGSDHGAIVIDGVNCAAAAKLAAISAALRNAALAEETGTTVDIHAPGSIIDLLENRDRIGDGPGGKVASAFAREVRRFAHVTNIRLITDDSPSPASHELANAVKSRRGWKEHYFIEMEKLKSLFAEDADPHANAAEAESDHHSIGKPSEAVAESEAEQPSCRAEVERDPSSTGKTTAAAETDAGATPTILHGPSPEMDNFEEVGAESAKFSQAGARSTAQAYHAAPALPPFVAQNATPRPAWLQRQIRCSRYLYKENVPFWLSAVRGRAQQVLLSVGMPDEAEAILCFLSAPTDLLQQKEGGRRNAKQRRKSQAASITGKPDANDAHGADSHPPTQTKPLDPSCINAAGIEQDSAEEARIIDLVLMGAPRRAAQALSSEAIPLQPSPEVVAKLQKLHPPAAATPPTAPPIPTTDPSDDQVRLALKMLSRGSAPGPDGWTRELIAPIISDRIVATAFRTIFRGVLSGRYTGHPELRSALTAARIIPLSKPGKPDAVRPIAIESAILRFASHAALLCSGNVATALAARQYGVGLGTERAVHRTRSLIDDNTCMIFVDAENAFNTIRRDKIMQTIYASARFEPLWGITDLCYRAPSELLVLGRDGVEATILSQEGVRQGSVLGPFYFALGFDDTVRKYGDNAVAYLDDLAVRCKPSEVATTLATIEAEMKRVGLSVNYGVGKTTVLCPPDLTSRLPTMRCAVTSTFFRALGSPVGFDEPSMRNYCETEAGSSRTFFQKCGCLHPAIGLRLLSLCGIPRLNFLTRATPPSLTMSACKIFDGYVKRCLTIIVGGADAWCDAMPDLPWALSNLPLALGGLGLRRYESIAEIAYNASLHDVDGGQREETQALEKHTFVTLLEKLNERERAHVLSCSDPSTASFFSLLGTSGPTGEIDLTKRMLAKPLAARHALRHRLMLDRQDGDFDCPCGMKAKGSEHALSCVKYSKTPTHDAVTRELSRCILELGLPTTLNLADFRAILSGKGGKSREAPDLLIDRGVAGGRIAVDTTIPHASSATAITRGAAKTGGAAVAHAEAEKVKQNDELCKEKGYAFRPLAMDACGRLGPLSRKWLTELATESLMDAKVGARWVAITTVRLQKAMMEHHGLMAHRAFLLQLETGARRKRARARDAQAADTTGPAAFPDTDPSMFISPIDKEDDDTGECENRPTLNEAFAIAAALTTPPPTSGAAQRHTAAAPGSPTPTATDSAAHNRATPSEAFAKAAALTTPPPTSGAKHTTAAPRSPTPTAANGAAQNAQAPPRTDSTAQKKSKSSTRYSW